MPRPGGKPKLNLVRLVTGRKHVTRYGTPEEIRQRVEKAMNKFGKPVKPKQLTGEAEFAWNRYIVPAWWLDGAREPAAVAFCQLWQEFRKDPIAFKKHGAMRSYMSELGLTDERNRILNGSFTEPDEFLD
jgi:hypothetical protein